MRQLALVGLLLSVLLGGIAVFNTIETVSHRRASQDRSLQIALSMEIGRISGSEHQMTAAAGEMLVNPAIERLLVGVRSTRGQRAADLAVAGRALASFEASASLPLASACIDDAAGKQLACGPTAEGTLFPSWLRRRFAALAAATAVPEVTRTFLSPLDGRPAGAFVVPLRAAGRLLGLVHFDIASATTQGSALLVENVPGVRTALVGLQRGELLRDGALSPLAAAGHGQSGRGPYSTISEGRRAMVAGLPLRVAGGTLTLAVLASESAADPTLANAWSPEMLALLGLALLTLIGSIGALLVADRRTERELCTDPLTTLRNRRALMAELPRMCARATDAEPALLWMFDLNGFKGYNDSFGHLAGDALLGRLGRRLRDTVAPFGETYRLGGDEFCVLIGAPGPADPLALFEHAREALCERGAAFTVTASAGAVELPRDAADASHALRLADQHMYRDKATSRGGAAELVTAVLHAALAQRHPELDEHSSDVAADVEVLAQRIGLDEEAVAMIIRAGDLHDVGKLGIPDEIIAKAGPLSPAEWEFMRQHTVMGERIIAAAGPSLEPVAPLVRASHERWDGMGYPDGLKSEEIPLGARIITICDSFRAMLSDRPYKASMSLPDALDELRRCAGTQFDPKLVEVFCRIVGERSSAELNAQAQPSLGGLSPS